MCFNTGKLLQYDKAQNFCWLFVTQASIFYFKILWRVTCGNLVTPVQLSQNVLRQLQVTGWADLEAV